MNQARVLIVAGSDASSERLVVRGFHEVALLHGWHLLRYFAHGAELQDLLATWDPAAVVLSWNLPTPYPASLGKRVVVAMHADHQQSDLPCIAVDDERVGELAAEHMLATGLTDFATFWFQDHPFAVRRTRGFARGLEQAGVFLHRTGEFGSGHACAERPTHAVIAQWLNSLPKPCGIFACCDHWANSLSTYCRAVGARVPEDIALMGAENDELECEVSAPPITSVSIPWFSAGRELARLVRRGLEGRKAPPHPVIISPLGVVARRSTDVTAVTDPEVSAAVRWIRDNAHRPIAVPDVCNAIPAYRQRLERRLRLVLGRTIMQEVRSARVELAKRLLRASSLSVPEVADRTGFGSATMLGVTFRKETGETPTHYRRRFTSDVVERCRDQ